MVERATFEVLPGLPGYGPAAESFSATGQGAHRESYVVKIVPAIGESWVGNFHPGMTKFNGVSSSPAGRRLIVVSCGQGYVVDPLDRNFRQYLSSDISAFYVVPELPAVILNGGTRLFAFGDAGILWETKRISWDGIYDVQVRYPKMHGLTWSPLSDTDVPFAVDLINGRASGGSYG